MLSILACVHIGVFIVLDVIAVVGLVCVCVCAFVYIVLGLLCPCPIYGGVSLLPW